MVKDRVEYESNEKGISMNFVDEMNEEIFH